MFLGHKSLLLAILDMIDLKWMVPNENSGVASIRATQTDSYEIKLGDLCRRVPWVLLPDEK